jgi:hypothetical protein
VDFTDTRIVHENFTRIKETTRIIVKILQSTFTFSTLESLGLVDYTIQRNNLSTGREFDIGFVSFTPVSAVLIFIGLDWCDLTVFFTESLT